jgi:formylglycine-generating enzyme
MTDITTTAGIRMVRVEPGTFIMGTTDPLFDEHIRNERKSRWGRLEHRRWGDPDEHPSHPVTITSFLMGAHPVTNAQYEQFDPSHRELRGKLGFSKDDDEAVVFISWHDAVRFCEWLSEREGTPYRLPTEAEWEFACRAGTTGPFHTGDSLPEELSRDARISWYPDPERTTDEDIVPLHVAKLAANAWDLYDMHGLVEEWCSDWYGPYQPGTQANPIGPADGDFRVTRGGSHSTEEYFLRSANRMGTLPDERSWLIGFRVVQGEMPDSEPSPQQSLELWQRNVSQDRAEPAPTDPDEPFFSGPRIYVKIPPGSEGPIFEQHNHVPTIVPCPNGDLLAAWYTCVEEPGREVATVASRLRYGQDEWESASIFWDAPDRNDHASALWHDGDGRIYHIVGLSAAATWGNLATVIRTSDDNGVTWSKGRLIIPEHGPRHMPIPWVFRAQDGSIVFPCDAVSGGHGGTALWISRDEGETWNDAGGTIAGIHAAVTQLDDGRLRAFGRGDEVDGMMPMSISGDMGKTWEVTASPFQPVHGGQRAALLKLHEGPLFFAGFANEPLDIVDETGTTRPITGLYCALSLDDGETWINHRPLSDDGDERLIETMDGYFRPMGRTRSELAGYITARQDDNGYIQFISSRNHYTFNLAWLRNPAPPA